MAEGRRKPTLCRFCCDSAFDDFGSLSDGVRAHVDELTALQNLVGAEYPVRALHLDFLRSQAEWQGGRWR